MTARRTTKAGDGPAGFAGEYIGAAKEVGWVLGALNATSKSAIWFLSSLISFSLLRVIDNQRAVPENFSSLNLKSGFFRRQTAGKDLGRFEFVIEGDL